MLQAAAGCIDVEQTWYHTPASTHRVHEMLRVSIVTSPRAHIIPARRMPIDVEMAGYRCLGSTLRADYARREIKLRGGLRKLIAEAAGEYTPAPSENH